MHLDTEDRTRASAVPADVRPDTNPAVYPVVGVLALLLIEFLDELTFGGRETAWPLIRDDLGLSYVEIGLLISIPTLVANLAEPAIGILGDVWNRRALVLGGGIVFAGGLVLAAFAPGFWTLMLAFTLCGPASGSFVNLAQASLMDAEPLRRERSMAMWALAGSSAMSVAPFVLMALVALGYGWRTLFLGIAAIMAATVVAVWRMPFRAPAVRDGHGVRRSFVDGVTEAARAIRDVEVLRWLALLECSDLMLDVLHGYLALYFVDVTGAPVELAALAIAVWTVVGLPGDALMIPLLARVDGLRYLRVSAVVSAMLFVGFLLAPSILAKLVLLGLLGLSNAGWYSILKARLYGALPDRSGTVMAVSSTANLIGGAIPLVLGLLADAWGLGPVMWLLLAGPIGLLVGLRRSDRRAA